MSTDTISVSHAKMQGQRSMRNHGTETSDVTHEAGLLNKALGLIAQAGKNFLGFEQSREVGKMLAAV